MVYKQENIYLFFLGYFHPVSFIISVVSISEFYLIWFTYAVKCKIKKRKFIWSTFEKLERHKNITSRIRKSGNPQFYKNICADNLLRKDQKLIPVEIKTDFNLRKFWKAKIRVVSLDNNFDLINFENISVKLTNGYREAINNYTEERVDWSHKRTLEIVFYVTKVKGHYQMYNINDETFKTLKNTYNLNKNINSSSEEIKIDNILESFFSNPKEQKGNNQSQKGQIIGQLRLINRVIMKYHGANSRHEIECPIFNFIDQKIRELNS